ncbi:flavin-containing monooxygenase [Paenibacillus sp. DMB20]|uniref:flavin-containing monooxygenase n=1 Tax=Paenibacillus sp. DMB20 TaxID=1642570 RepID=UPI0006282A22|nr:NAD(P)/FAD-dependent oxidoreductase [Paenibacillus sp. DMB20]KKO54346.1 oxidoreductase [Paenibacillus sp. DMB20]
MWQVLIIGAGQAGLAAAYWLKRAGVRFLALERGSGAGEAWASRYESLRLFTPRTHSALPGLKLEGEPAGFPSKGEMSLYLKKYAELFELPIQYETKVTSVRQENGLFAVSTSRGYFRAEQLIIATGPFQKPRLPAFSGAVPDDIVHLHSSLYKHPSQLQDGNVLVVGGGNSGAQIAVELSNGRETFLAVSRPPRYLPMTVAGEAIFWWLDRLGLLRADSSSWIGRRLRRAGDPIFGYELKQAVRCGKVILKRSAVGFGSGGVRFEDGSELDVRNIVWATGFDSGYEWLHVKEALDHHGRVLHNRGMSPVKGLYYVGLPWQTHRGSALLAGVGRDAREIVNAIIERGDKHGKRAP